MSSAAPHPSTPGPEPIGPGRFVLVVGPSGAGKDTVIAGAKTACGSDASIVFPRRVVTRVSSGHEDHDSLTEAAFDGAAQAGAFAFWWAAHGLKYGVPRAAAEDVRCGRTIVCNVSRAVVAEVRARYARVDVVLITAPASVLAARLATRGRASDGSLAQRLGRNDVYAEFHADHVIENTDAPEAAVQSLLDVIYAKTPAIISNGRPPTAPA